MTKRLIGFFSIGIVMLLIAVVWYCRGWENRLVTLFLDNEDKFDSLALAINSSSRFKTIDMDWVVHVDFGSSSDPKYSHAKDVIQCRQIMKSLQLKQAYRGEAIMIFTPLKKFCLLQGVHYEHNANIDPGKLVATLGSIIDDSSKYSGYRHLRHSWYLYYRKR